MKIIIEMVTNGIYEYAIIKIEGLTKNFPIEKIKKILSKFNKEQMDGA